MSGSVPAIADLIEGSTMAVTSPTASRTAVTRRREAGSLVWKQMGPSGDRHCMMAAREKSETAAVSSPNGVTSRQLQRDAGVM